MAGNIIPLDDNSRSLYSYDPDEDIIKVGQYVWSPSTLDWERMTQPAVYIEGGEFYLQLEEVEYKLQQILNAVLANYAYTLSYDGGGKLTGITSDLGVMTLTWDGDQLTGISKWVAP